MDGAANPSRIRLPALTPLQASLALCLLSGPLIFFGIGTYGVVNADEALYHDIALRMLETGAWFRVETGRLEYVYDTFANAPLQYWARGFVLSFAGDGMLGMRMLSSISALLAVLATYRSVLWMAGRRAALLAGLFLITTFQFLYLHSARTGELEPAVCLLLVCLAYLFTRCLEDPTRSLLPHHICLALLFNLKAPVIAIPLLAELACFVLVPAARARFGAWLRLGVAILPFALAWHGYQAWRLQETLEGVIRNVIAQAAGDGSVAGALRAWGHGRFYLETLYFGAYPSVLLYPFAIFSAFAVASRRQGTPTRLELGMRVWLIYLLTTFFFYVAIAKLGPWYIVHTYPFFAALLGVWLAGLAERGGGWVMLTAVASLGAVGLWLRPDLVGFNPFAESAIQIPMLTPWRGASGIAMPLAFALLGFGLLAWAARRFEQTFWPTFAAVLAASVLGVSLVRAWLPLRYTDHLSPIASLHEGLSERMRGEEAILLPIELPAAHTWIVDYYFLRDFEVRIAADGKRRRSEQSPRYVLHPRRS